MRFPHSMALALRNFRFLMICGLIYLAQWNTVVRGQTPQLPRKTAGRQTALLIGCEKYQKVTPLLYVSQDVQKLGEILRDRAGFDEVLEATDLSEDLTRRPVKSSMLSLLTSYLQRRQVHDNVIVYFSGHGFRDKSGAMYLAPLDADPANLAATGVPVAWLRDQLAQCKAQLKLLILDACHAGSTKGESYEANLGPQDLALFEQLEGVITLASSTAEQPSQIWEEKQHSLFTYWLNQGLKGHADTDGNGEIDIDEIYEYVHRNVTSSAEKRLHRPQTPVRKIGLRTPGTPVVAYLRPQKLKQVLAEMAQQLADTMIERKLESVGVLEFTSNSKLGELLGTDYGLLGKYCAEQVEEKLLKCQEGRFKVINRRVLLQAMRDQKFAVSDLGSTEALKSLSARTGGMPVIAAGLLSGRAGRMLTLRCQLIQTNENDVASIVGGTAWISESEWAMLGRSVAVAAVDQGPDSVQAGQSPRPRDDLLVDRLDEKSSGPHPLSDQNTKYRIWLTVNGKERQGTFRGNKYYVPLRKGEEYEIYIENRSQELTLMRLLVDGLNTQLETDSPVASSETSPVQAAPPLPQEKGLMTYLVGKHVNLEEARGWVLDPNDVQRLAHARLNQSNPNLYVVRGFVTKLGKEGEMARFTVVDASQSLAARQQFTSQIGMITAAFYTGSISAPVEGVRGIGTQLGNKIAQNLESVKAEFGPLRGVIHIHYYNPDDGLPE